MLRLVLVKKEFAGTTHLYRHPDAMVQRDAEQMKLRELTRLIRITAEDGTNTVLAEIKAFPERLTKAEAYRRYGRSNVDRWLLEGLVKISNKSIDRTKLESIAESSNRITYLPVAER